MRSTPAPPFTEREALELADRIESHATLLEKLAFYKTLVDDPELHGILVRCREVSLEHTQRLEALLKDVQNESDWNAYSHYEPYRQSYHAGLGGE